MKTHELKTWMPFFEECVTERKKFELRKNDRNFQIGDELCLQEFDQYKQEYTGREQFFEVSYVLLGGRFGLEVGYCILGIEYRH